MPNRYEFVLSSSIIVAVLSLATPALAQTQLSPVASDRLAYDSIEHRLSSYRHVMPEPSRLAISTDDETPAALEAYCDGEKLRLVVATYAEEAGHSVDRYYFRNDSLLFLYHRLDVPTGPRTPDHIDEERLYLSADTLVRWLGAHNASRPLPTPRARQRTKEALSRAAAFRRALAGCKG